MSLGEVAECYCRWCVYRPDSLMLLLLPRTTTSTLQSTIWIRYREESWWYDWMQNGRCAQIISCVSLVLFLTRKSSDLQMVLVSGFELGLASETNTDASPGRSAYLDCTDADIFTFQRRNSFESSFNPSRQTIIPNITTASRQYSQPSLLKYYSTLQYYLNRSRISGIDILQYSIGLYCKTVRVLSR